MDEAKLISEVLSGEQSAYAPLVERYHIGLILYCEQFTKDRANAEDLAQEAFIQAYKSLSKFDTKRGQFSTWLYMIAKRKVFSYIRKEKITIDIDQIPEIEAVVGPMSEAQKSEVRSAVERLEPPIYKSVIEAYYWRGQSYDQISKEFNIPLNTVRTHLRRAKEKLKGVLA